MQLDLFPSPQKSIEWPQAATHEPQPDREDSATDETPQQQREEGGAA